MNTEEYVELLLMAVEIATGEISVNFDSYSILQLNKLKKSIMQFMTDNITEEQVNEMIRLSEEYEAETKNNVADIFSIQPKEPNAYLIKTEAKH